MPASSRRKYLKSQTIVAVQLDFPTDGLVYRKWGGTQRAKRGDWVVQSGKDVYTVARRVFAKTYRLVNRKVPGIYRKITPIWAERATRAGVVKTKEGATRYKAGDFLVSNDKAGKDSWAISRATFTNLYQPASKRR